MSKRRPSSGQRLMDAIRPSEEDGPLKSAILATYGLSIAEPNFFEHDFLPTLMGLGGVRDRANTAPVTLERKLAGSYCAVICDSHALADERRPSLRVDVIPIARPLHHAKIILIHRRNLVRVIVSSANLTDAGYRHNRESAVIFDFRDTKLPARKSLTSLPTRLLADFVDGWLQSLGPYASPPLEAALRGAVEAAKPWKSKQVDRNDSQVRIVFGGGDTPLWQALVEEWPKGEPVLEWRICSPFWPDPDSSKTPFEKIATGLQQRDASLEETRLELICEGEMTGEKARPLFPFPLVRELRNRGFPISRGRIVAARLDALPEEIPDGKEVGNRTLHSKWILLRGRKTAVAFLGSANFTNRGLGVVPPANIEAGVLIRIPVSNLHESSWNPPLAEEGAVEWEECGDLPTTVQQSEIEEHLDWPTHLRRVELDIDWTQLPDPPGTLWLEFERRDFVQTVVSIPSTVPGSSGVGVASIDAFPAEGGGRSQFGIDASAVRQLLTRRVIHVAWGQPPKMACIPINILESARVGLPSVLAAKPSEQQLLNYFHGRISEDDLLEQLENAANPPAQGATGQSNPIPPSLLIQNYIVREFVESLSGIENSIREAAFSARSLEMALLGEFSPISLAEQVIVAWSEGRRSPTAAGFQLAEILRVVANISLNEPCAPNPQMNAVRERAVDKLSQMLRKVLDHTGSQSGLGQNKEFLAYLKVTLPSAIVERMQSTSGKAISSTVTPGPGTSHDTPSR